MSDVPDALFPLWFGMIAAEWVVFIMWFDWWRTYRRLTRPLYAVLTFFLAIQEVLQENWANAVLFSIYSVGAAYSWWNDDDNKRNRRKLRDRLARKVVNLGGRLGVVQPSEG